MARQYSGTAGWVENCQVGTFLGYRSARGHTLIDRELYLPEAWTSDRDRCAKAGVPDDVVFTTKPRQAIAMIGRAVDAGVPFGWVIADEAYGQVKYLRVWLEERSFLWSPSAPCLARPWRCMPGLSPAHRPTYPPYGVARFGDQRRCDLV